MSDKQDPLLKRIEQLEDELHAVKNRMNQLETQLNQQNKLDPFGLLDATEKAPPKKQMERPEPSIKKQPKPEPIMEKELEPIVAAKQIDPVIANEQTPPAAKEPKESPSFEQILGTWLPRVFMVVLILGVLWGLKIGMDNGWISYEVRIALGYISTVLLYLFGRSSIRKGHHIFGITLFGGLIAIGVLVTMAAYYLYHLFPYPIAFAIGLIYIILGLWISHKQASETLTVLSGFAGFLLPYLIIGSDPQTWTFCLYMLLLFLSLFYIAIRSEHKVSYSVTFVFFQLSLLFYTLSALPTGGEWYIVGTALIQHLLLVYFYVKGSISRHVFTETVIYTNVVFMIGWISLLDTNTFVYGLFAGLYITLSFYTYTKKDAKLNGIFSAIAIFAISACILSVSFRQEESEIALLLINGAIGIWVGLRFKTIRTIVISGIIYGMAGLTALMMMIPALFSLAHLAWIVLLITVVFIYISLYKYGIKLWSLSEKNINISLIIGQIIGMIYIYQLSDFVLSKSYTFDVWDIRDHLQLFTLIAASLLSFLAYKWKHGKYITIAATIEFLLLGLMLAVLPLHSISNGLLFTKLVIELCYFALLTALFIVIWKNRFSFFHGLHNHIAALAFVMQLVYFYILHKWYFAITDIYVMNYEFVYLGHTLWMFLFAFLSVSLGIRYKWNVVKLVGLALIGICLIKLFFIDLINVSIIVRAILFIVVGIVGLIYSRLLIKNNEKA